MCGLDFTIAGEIKAVGIGYELSHMACLLQIYFASFLNSSHLSTLKSIHKLRWGTLLFLGQVVLNNALY